MSTYGKVGWDVGVVGRWFRLLMGALMMLLVLGDYVGGNHTHSLGMNALAALFFVGFVIAYFGIYLLVVDRVKHMNPWIPTIIFVLPAMYFIFNGLFAPFELSFGYMIGLPYVNHPITIAILLYVGISLPIQFFTRYGGCEVIAIQNLIYRKECSSYCVPLLPLDIAEKAIVDRLAQRQEAKSMA